MAWPLDAFYLFALTLVSPWLAWRAWRTGRYRNLRAKLLGPQGPVGPGDSVWFHGVSVGEVHLLRAVVGGFRRAFPDIPCVVSSTTDTGLAEARRCFADLPVFAFPFDFSWAVRRTLRQVRPRLLVLAEGELWPNLLLAARDAGVPVAVVNARMSPRSLGRYRLVGSLVRRLLGCVDLLLAQGDEYAAAFRSLGAAPECVVVTGSVKYDGAVTDRQRPDTLALRERFGIRPDDIVWVAGSTQAPEEEIAVGIHEALRGEHPHLRLILVPRHPDRFDAVADLLRRRGTPFVRRSRLTEPPPAGAVLLVDTLGELGAIWGLADVAFVGGSLDGKRGGQNMIEAAAPGAAVLFGPHVWNFREPAARLVAAGAAVQVADAAHLAAEVRRLLNDSAVRARMGEAGRQFVQRQQGATERTVVMLGELVRRRSGRQAA